MTREAATIGLQAADNVKLFQSQRIYDEMRTLAEAATPHRRITEVAQLRRTLARLVTDGVPS